MRTRKRDRIKVLRPMAYIYTSKHFVYLHISLIHLIVYKTLFIDKESERYKFLLLLH
jgi:hypothetical protein